jgi:2-polyprenyl-6-hydroxyphenyl methylase / 3-demethylubiquinone-9 3-methyltransferase
MAAGTLDPAEIAKFSALAGEWWNPKGPFGALHRLNPVRLAFIRDRARAHFSMVSPPSPQRGEGGRAEGPATGAASPWTAGVLAGDGVQTAKPSRANAPSPARTPAVQETARSAKPLAGLAVLDIGCGGGLVSVPLARMGGAVTAIDASPEAIGAARAYAMQAGLEIEYRCTSAEALVEAGAAFDLVTALEIIEHVADVRAFLAAATALVKPGGLIVLSTINRTAKARALAIVGAERILQWAPEGAHDYDKLVKPEEIRAAAPGIMWDEPVGITYNPLGAGWALSGDTDVNYLMAGKS